MLPLDDSDTVGWEDLSEEETEQVQTQEDPFTAIQAMLQDAESQLDKRAALQKYERVIAYGDECNFQYFASHTLQKIIRLALELIWNQKAYDTAKDYV